MRRGVFRSGFYALLAASLACGCAADGGVQRQRIFDFSESNLDSTLINAGIYHEVNLIFELNPETDLGGRTVLARVLPRYRGNEEVYSVLGLHEVTYAFGRFEVAGHRYTPRDGASRLYVFKPREGEFRFRYRTQPIVLKGRGRWVPSLYFNVQTGGAPGNLWRVEYVQFGQVKIEADSRRDHWLVNGKPYSASPSRPLVFELVPGGYAELQ